jgi:FAS-associated factor 2
MLLCPFRYMLFIQLLYDFVESNDLEPIDLLEEVVVVNTYPRKEYRDKSISFETAGLYPTATVIVEELFDDDD